MLSHNLVAPPERLETEDNSNDDIKTLVSPSQITKDILVEHCQELRLNLQLNISNQLLPFIQEALWFWEDPVRVHGKNPTVPCVEHRERCLVCLQHALPRSLPSVLREKYVLHDHAYSDAPVDKQSIVEKVVLSLIEKNYLKAFEQRMCQAQVKTNDIRKVFPQRHLSRAITARSDDSRFPGTVEGMDNIIESPWAVFPEVEIQSIDGGSLENGQLESEIREYNLTPQDQMFFMVRTKTDKSKKHDIIIEKHVLIENPLKEIYGNPHSVATQTNSYDFALNRNERMACLPCQKSSLKGCPVLEKLVNKIDCLPTNSVDGVQRESSANPIHEKRHTRGKKIDFINFGGFYDQRFLCGKLPANESCVEQSSLFLRKSVMKRELPDGFNEEEPVTKWPRNTSYKTTKWCNEYQEGCTCASCDTTEFLAGSLESRRNTRNEQPMLLCDANCLNDVSALDFNIFSEAVFYGRNFLTARCSICDISFHRFAIRKGQILELYSKEVAIERKTRHETLHQDELRCVYSACFEKRFASKLQLVSHMDSHRQALMSEGTENWETSEHGSFPESDLRYPQLTCHVCSITFNWKTSVPGMASHVKRYHCHLKQHVIEYKKTNSLWNCVLDGCGKFFSDEDTLETHMWYQHALQCYCENCQWIVWGDSKEVTIHRTECFATIRAVVPVDNLKTGVRAKLFKNKQRKKAVQDGNCAASAVHLMNFTFYCEFCGAPFRRHHSKQFRKHVRNHLPDRNLTCVFEDCGLEFSSSQQLHAHVKTKLSTCRYCAVVLFEGYKKHILTCKALHEINKQHLLREEVNKTKLVHSIPENLFWQEKKLCKADDDATKALEAHVAQETFLGNVNLIKGSIEVVKENARRQEQLRNQIHVANGKGRRSCTVKKSCNRCGKVFRNSVNLNEHMRGYHNLNF